MTPGRDLARVRGKATVQVGPYIARRARQRGHEIGLTGRQGRIAREGQLGGRRTRRRESQFVEALTQSIFESHDGKGRRAIVWKGNKHDKSGKRHHSERETKHDTRV